MNLNKQQIYDILLESRIPDNIDKIDFDENLQVATAYPIFDQFVIPDFTDNNDDEHFSQSQVIGLVNLSLANAFDIDSACGQNIGWTSYRRIDPTCSGYAICKSINSVESFYTIFVC